METDMENEIVQPKRSLPKFVFIILALILAGEAFFAIKTLSQPTQGSIPKLEKVSTTAKVNLISTKSEYKVNDSIPVEIQIDTGGNKISAADVVIHFDPSMLVATSSDIIRGTTFKDYPSLGVDQKAGTVTVAGISELNNNLTGIFNLATVNFTAKAVGTTAVTIIFDPGLTTDTNLVGSGTNKDILEKVENLNLTVK